MVRRKQSRGQSRRRTKSRSRISSRSRTQSRTGAFTLVELMIVIIIIGILAGLLSVAAYNAVLAARKARVKAEIDSMDVALQQYATDRGEVPPCLVDRDASNGNQTRQQTLLAHLRKAFPRFLPQGYSQLQTAIAKPYDPATNATRPRGFNLNIDNIDAAEALVLWLGGPPGPRDNSGNSVGSTKLQGWSANVSNPFDPDGSRAKTAFEFVESRLVDLDQDGWWEYAPDIATAGGPTPPYVYFDAPLYNTFTFQSYPSPLNTMLPKNPGKAAIDLWGVAVPYMSKYDAANQKNSTWINPKKFQIISAGLDSVYTLETYRGPGGSKPLSEYPIFPIGTNYKDGEQDNLTNFCPGTLKDEVQ